MKRFPLVRTMLRERHHHLECLMADLCLLRQMAHPRVTPSHQLEANVHPRKGQAHLLLRVGSESRPVSCFSDRFLSRTIIANSIYSCSILYGQSLSIPHLAIQFTFSSSCYIFFSAFSVALQLGERDHGIGGTIIIVCFEGSVGRVSRRWENCALRRALFAPFLPPALDRTA